MALDPVIGGAAVTITGGALTPTRIPVADSATSLTNSDLADNITGGVWTLSATFAANRTWTIPDRSDTFAGLGAQTFTGTQTVDGALTLSNQTGLRLSVNRSDAGVAAEIVGGATPTNASGKVQFGGGSGTVSGDWFIGGTLLLNTTLSAGNGLLQLASGTTKANGIAFGTDVFMYRIGAGALKIESDRIEVFKSAGDCYINANTGTVDTRLYSANGAGIGLVGTWTNHALYIRTNNADRFCFDTSGNFLGVTATGGIGYGTGAGGTATQITSRTTGVTLNKITGAITLVSAAGSAAWQSFTVTNSAVAATDTIICNQVSGTDLNMIHVTNIVAGSFRISFATTGGTTVETPVFRFTVLKSVSA
jgi:hypothetical protein